MEEFLRSQTSILKSTIKMVVSRSTKDQLPMLSGIMKGDEPWSVGMMNKKWMKLFSYVACTENVYQKTMMKVIKFAKEDFNQNLKIVALKEHLLPTPCTKLKSNFNDSVFNIPQYSC